MKVYTVKEAAKLLGVSAPTIYRLVEDKEIPCVRIRKAIRFTESQIKSALDQFTVEAAS